MENNFDVIIVGGGPVGLFLACELKLGGVSVLVLEREEKRNLTITDMPLGIRGFNNSSIETLYRRGLLDDIFAKGERAEYFEKSSKPQFAGHFAGNRLDLNKLDLSRWKYKLNGPSLIPGGTCLEKIYVAFTKRAEKLGATILKGHEVTSATQDDSGVEVTANGKKFRGKYLVGCEGGRSVIRKTCGFEFVGTEPLFTGYNVLCELEDPEKLAFGFNPTTNGMYIWMDNGDVRIVDFDGGANHRSENLTREHLQAVLRRASGTDVTIKKVNFVATWTDRAMQATTYRNKRIFLAGDSAHIHSPLGGQGLNAGIGDAINLGWKLAATIHETAPESLLETYTKERHPVGAWVLEWTRAQVETLKPDLFGKASKRLVQDLIATVDGTNYFIDKVWGLSQRYDLDDSHPLVGASVPDFELTDGTRLGPKLRDGKAAVIDFSEDNNLLSLTEKYNVNYFRIAVKDNLGLKSLVVRPDGIVISATSDNAEAALRKWFLTKDAHHLHV